MCDTVHSKLKKRKPSWISTDGFLFSKSLSQRLRNPLHLVSWSSWKTSTFN